MESRKTKKQWVGGTSLDSNKHNRDKSRSCGQRTMVGRVESPGGKVKYIYTANGANPGLPVLWAEEGLGCNHGDHQGSQAKGLNRMLTLTWTLGTASQGIHGIHHADLGEF